MPKPSTPKPSCYGKQGDTQTLNLNPFSQSKEGDADVKQKELDSVKGKVSDLQQQIGDAQNFARYYLVLYSEAELHFSYLCMSYVCREKEAAAKAALEDANRAKQDASGKTQRTSQLMGSFEREQEVRPELSVPI